MENVINLAHRTSGEKNSYSLSDYLFWIVATSFLILVTYFLLFSERKNPNQFINNNSFGNYNSYINPNRMNYNGRGYPMSEGRNFNLNNNNMRNDDFLSSNNGSPGFRNMMRSNNENMFEGPRGSAFSNRGYGRFSGSNINMNNNLY